MKIFLDTADVDEIRKAHETGLINGVTTNPTLIKRSGRDPVEVIKEISSSFSSLLHLSVSFSYHPLLITVNSLRPD